MCTRTVGKAALLEHTSAPKGPIATMKHSQLGIYTDREEPERVYSAAKIPIPKAIRRLTTATATHGSLSNISLERFLAPGLNTRETVCSITHERETVIVWIPGSRSDYPDMEVDIEGCQDSRGPQEADAARPAAKTARISYREKAYAR